jgi:hypothetical protein
MILLVAGILGRQADTATAAGELKLSVVGKVRSEQYPTVEVTLSAVDGSTGRPVTELTVDGVEFSDESGRLPVVEVTAVASEKVPTAYVLLIDTGGAMSPYLARATELARGFIQRMGPNDVVRVVKFNEGVDDAGTNWVRRDDPNLAAQVSNLVTTDRVSLVKPALSRATEIAGTAPEGYARHGVVALVAIDGARTETGLSIDKVKADVRAPTFTFGFGTAPVGHEELTFFLEEVRTDAEIDAALGRYRLQGAAYALALSETLGRPVTRCVFVFVRRGKDAEEREIEDLAAAMDEIRARIPEMASL